MTILKHIHEHYFVHRDICLDNVVRLPLSLITLLGLLPVLYAASWELCRVVLTGVPDFGRKV